MPRRLLLCLVAVLLPLAGCDLLDPEPFEPRVVVSALLYAGQPLPSLRLVESGPFDEPENLEQRLIEDAEVSVLLLAEEGGVEETYDYVYRSNGFYRPFDIVPPEVLGGRTYRLVAEVPGYEATVRAETTVPTAFEVVRAPADTIRYQVDPQPSLDVTPSASPGRASVYVFTVEALEPDPAQLTPFAAALFDNGAADMDDLVLGNSPLLNAENYERNPDGTIAIRIPWLSINFYGPHLFYATALDQAMVEFLQSQAIQFNPSTLSPGEIPAVISNVENGAGVFGSVAQVVAESFIARP